MKGRQSLLYAALLLTLLPLPARTQDVCSDTWAATDALGRKVRSCDGAPARREGKQVVIFYSTWHQGHHSPDYPAMNISEIVRAHPEAMQDYDHPAWGKKKPHSFYWEQPLFGYYQTTDRWVLRKHAELLAAAGVDAVFFDCTNGSRTFEDSYEALLETWAQARADGVPAPSVGFILNFNPVPTTLTALRQLWRDLYRDGRYADLWFRWKGKPCIMAYPDVLTSSEEDRQIAEFFTFRPCQVSYVLGPGFYQVPEGQEARPDRNDQWGWLENYPQHGYVATTLPDGRVRYEETSVGVAQNTNPEREGHCGAFNTKDAQGRHFSARNGFDPRPEGWLYGWNFEEQWERAYELDPEVVFVTGWNEWIAGQWLPKDGWNGVPFSFVDQYNWLYSRDIEPNKGWGDKGDCYYLQLVDKVRKFKGMEAGESVSGPKTIRRWDDWDDVRPHYGAWKGDIFPRNHPGLGDNFYTDSTGRNDIVGAKVARDGAFLYFCAETADALSPPEGPHWMQLLVDVDRDRATGWNGYDFIVNRVGPKGGKAFLERNVQGIWMWEEAAKVKLFVRDNRLWVRIPRAVLGIGPRVDIEFKWNDNMQREGDIMDFYVSGDTAPPGRFNYVYSE